MIVSCTLYPEEAANTSKYSEHAKVRLVSLVLLLKHIVQELNKLDAYKQSKWDINELTSAFKKRVLVRQ